MKIRRSLGPLLGLAAGLLVTCLPIAAQRTTHATNRIAAPIDDRFTVARPADVHPLARKEYDTGAVSPDMRLERMVLVLAPDADQQTALEELVTAQQDPASPEYQQWLTPETFGASFGISESDAGQIVRWLEMHGFAVEPVSTARRSIVFSGSAAQVAAAFHTEIHAYNINGERHYANASAPRIPEALDAVVAGVVSLHDFRAQPMHIRSSWTTSSGTHGVVPGDFATIYDLGPLYANSTDGTGQSIAIAGRTNINLADVTTFRSTFGLPANNPTIVLNGANPGIVSTDEEGEAALDVEWSGAVAKMASIQFVVSASTSTTDGIALSSQYIVNHNLAPALSLSFGNCEAAMGASGNQFWSALWQQAASQGITVLVASGDSGAAGCDDPSSTTASYGRAVNGLCSSPYSTCVGGTEFNDTANPSSYWSTANSSTYTSALSYIPEATWNESAAVSGGSGLWSSGGGASAIYTKPSWQSGPGVPSDGWRDVPDVSLHASGNDPTLMYMNGSFYSVSGTSVATPCFAGLMALANQKVGTRLGNVNPALYTLAAKQDSGGAAVFHDITTGNNSVPGVTGYSAGTGYDLATGLGSVDAALLVNHWGDAGTPGPSFQMSASPTSLAIKAGASGSTTVTLSLSGGFNSAVVLTASGLPSGLTASFSPATVPAGSTSSTLKLTASTQAAAASNSVTINATGGGITQTTPVAVTISPACSYAINPTSATPPAAAGTYTVNVTATTGCSWTAVSNSSWITVTSGATGSGNGTVNYSLAANTATATRSGAIVIAGLSLAVTQAAAAPQYSLTPSSASFTAAAGTGSITVTDSSATASWTAVSNASWITITKGATGTGSGTVNYLVAANTATATRSGAIVIAGLSLAVTQAAAAPQYSLAPTSASFTAAAGTGSITVTDSSATASWTAVSNASWITITKGATGTGSGTVNYSVAANTTTTARSGAIAIAGLSLAVTQAAAAPQYSLAPTSASFTAAAGTGSITVTDSSATASWTAVSNASWITITKGATGTGSGTVNYSVAANTTTTARSGAIAIAGLSFAVTQAAAAPQYSLTPTTASFTAAAGTGSITVTDSSATASWTAVSNASWITITKGATGTGSGTVNYSVAANTAITTRSGAIAIAGLSFAVTQAAAAPQYSLTPTTASFTATAGTGSITVTDSSATASWTAVSNASWITVTKGATGTGSGTVNYSVAANTATTTRSGAIAIAGLSFAVTQAAAAPQYSLTPTTASFTAAAGTGSITVTDSSTSASWTAVSNASWITITSGASCTGSKSVGYSVAANTSTSARTGTMTIAGTAFSVTQAGASTSASANCTYALGVSTQTPGATATVISFPVITPSGCGWTATSNASWLTVTSGATGKGPGVATYTVAADTTGAARSAVATIAGITVTFNEGK